MPKASIPPVTVDADHDLSVCPVTAQYLPRVSLLLSQGDAGPFCQPQHFPACIMGGEACDVPLKMGSFETREAEWRKFLRTLDRRPSLSRSCHPLHACVEKEVAMQPEGAACQPQL